MADARTSSSSSHIICASFNQDNNLFSIGTRDGFKIYDGRTGRLRYEKTLGAFSIVEMLFSSSLLALVGAGEQPSLSPRHLTLFNTVTGATLRQLNFLTSILAVRMNRKRLIVVLQDKTFVYDLNTTTILDEIDTVPNSKALCAFASNSEECYLALPASATKGSVLVYNSLELRSICQIDAHRSLLSVIAFSSNGMYLATASEKGTIIRVHLISQATKSYSYRRGTYPSTIYSLAFAPSFELPEILVAMSSSGSLHIFFLGTATDERKHAKMLGSLIPDSLAEAFDPANHHVIHNVVPPGVKSHLAISDLMSSRCNSTNPVLQAKISLITQTGFYNEYTLSVTHMNDISWSLEQEVNMLDPVPNAS